MISEETLSRILNYQLYEDKIPDERGEYKISYTSYGNSSLSLGGSYYDKANNLEFSGCNIRGLHERASWPGIYFITFNPNEMDEKDAEILITLLGDMHMHSSYPCLNEQKAYDMEAEDTMLVIKSVLDSLHEDGESDVPEGFDHCSDKAASIMLSLIYEDRPDAIMIETGPDVYIDEDAVKGLLPRFREKIREENT